LKRKFEENERFFSVELKSKVSLKNVTLTNGGEENVLVEGSIGELQHAEFSEGIILEVVGDKGVLRINISPDDIKQKEELEKEM
jgi:hypothetical protein